MNDIATDSVYLFIQAHILQRGYPPNLVEIVEGCLLTQDEVIETLNWLESTGRIFRKAGRPRSLRLAALGNPHSIKKQQPILADVIYTFICNYIQQYGYAPTIREIMGGVNRNSTSLISRHIEKLKKEGRLKGKPNAARTLTLCK